MANKKKTSVKPKAASAKTKATTAKSKTAAATPKEATAGERIGAEILGVVLIAVGILLAVYLFSQQPNGVGKFLHTAMFAVSGVAAYALPPLLVVLGVLTIASRKAEPVPGGKISVIITIVLLVALVHLVLGSVPYADGEHNAKMGVFLNQTYHNAIEPAVGVSRGGGVVGGFICYLLFILGGKALCYVVLLGGLVICALLITRLSIRTFAIKLHDNVQHAIERDSEYDDYDEDDETAVARDEAIRESSKSVNAVNTKKTAPIDPELKPRKDGLSELTLEDKSDKPKRKPKHIPFDEAFTVPEPEKPANPALDALEVLPQSGSLERKPRKAKPIKPEAFTNDAPITEAPPLEAPPLEAPPEDRVEPGTAAAPQIAAEAKPDAEKPRPVKKSKDAEPALGDSASEGEIPGGLMPAKAPENYIAPGIDCLIQPKQTYAKSADNPQEMGQLLVEVLESFNIQAKIVNIVVGPSVTRFELQPAPGIRVNKFTALSNDIALALAAQRVRIEAPIPGKAAVGVEIPNKDAATVLLRDIIESDAFESAKSPITMALGKDIGGKVVVSDLGKMPHMLIAGATGSGKSVCINAIIVSMVYKSSPTDLRLILIDPKKVELSVYASLPHLLMPVVTDPKRAAGALRWACTEMDARYKSFTEKGARDLARYNDLVEPERRLYKLVVIIDELADLMMVTPDDVEESICRIAQLGRAAGIHLIVATQRPSADVITGLIKANIPSRAAFAVSSSIDSRIILDSTGAEKLLGRGDMLFHPNGAGKPTRLQCAYVSDEEVEAVMAHFQSLQSEPQFVQSAIDGMNESGKGGPSGGVFGEGKQDDELLCEGVRIVMESGQASISMIQRRLRVGYARAARLIDIMEQHGYVSGFDGSKPRKVLITRARFAEEFGMSFDEEFEGETGAPESDD